MTVSDLKSIVPLADVYEINPNAKYIVKVPSAELAVAFKRAIATQPGFFPNKYILLCSGEVEFYEIS